MGSLANVSFETGLDGWTPFVLRGEPEFKIDRTSQGAGGADPRSAVWDGDASLHIEDHFRCFHAGVMQQVRVGAFARIELGAFGRAWSAPSGRPWGQPSDNSVHRRAWVGIDPSGGMSPESSGIVSISSPLFDDFRRIGPVSAVALAEVVTVFVAIENGIDGMWPLAEMHGYLDAVSLVVTPGPGQPPPPPGPAAGGIETIEDGGSFWRIVWRVPKL